MTEPSHAEIMKMIRNLLIGSTYIWAYICFGYVLSRVHKIYTYIRHLLSLVYVW